MPSRYSKQHKIIAKVEIACALNTMTIDEGRRIYQEKQLDNVAQGIEGYVKATSKRLKNGIPAHMKAAGTNAWAMFDVLFELGNETYIKNLITALEAEQKSRLKPNSNVQQAIDNAKEELEKMREMK